MWKCRRLPRGDNYTCLDTWEISVCPWHCSCERCSCGKVSDFYLFSTYYLITETLWYQAQSCKKVWNEYYVAQAHTPGEDPGFPVEGDANPPGGCQHTILPNFPKNCMKLRKFWSVGGAPLRSATPLTNTHHGTRHKCSLIHINQRISVLHMSAMKI